MAATVVTNGKYLSSVPASEEMFWILSCLYHLGLLLLHLFMSARLSVLSSFILNGPMLTPLLWLYSFKPAYCLLDTTFQTLPPGLHMPPSHSITVESPDSKVLSVQVQCVLALCTFLLVHLSDSLSESLTLQLHPLPPP